ncbi:hypothetical protein MTR67_044573 [Solanum verrucosum]|uniref:Cyclase family protein n=1 Tax=Solanum verrucosum TaxID=315347 RepID=A0AAF0UQS2_SOLVR|nr:hypothetical protein MTR67_044573 [Solanum verrucosum]
MVPKMGWGNFIKLETSIKLGDLSNYSVFKLATHSGTHVDAPGHFNQTLFESGYDVVSLHLPTLNGPVLVVDTPRDKNITGMFLIFGMIPAWLLAYFLDIIPVEGLNLDDAVPGVYTIHCLPLRLVHGDGSPTRCYNIRGSENGHSGAEPRRLQGVQLDTLC